VKVGIFVQLRVTCKQSLLRWLRFDRLVLSFPKNKRKTSQDSAITLTQLYCEHFYFKYFSPKNISIFKRRWCLLTKMKHQGWLRNIRFLFKLNTFPFKNKDKSHIFHTKATFTSCSAAPCLFCFEAICDRFFLKLNCFKLIGWFNNHNVFPPIRSVCYRFLHCDYRKVHCYYKNSHRLWLQKFALWLQKIALWLQKIALLFGIISCTEINQSQSSNNFMYISTNVITCFMLTSLPKNKLYQDITRN
jgi:hypothetical protein